MHCILMPFLHPRETDAALPAGAVRLSPALPASTSCFIPADLPLAQAEAVDLLRQFQNMDQPSLEALRAGFSQLQVAGDLRRQDELAGMAAFSGKKPVQDMNALLAAQAQKTLIWLWAMEETIFEIAALERRCSLAAACLQGNFSDGSSGAVAPVDYATPDFSNYPWKAALVCACRFIAVATPILLEEPAFGAAREYLDFKVSPCADGPRGMILLRACAPLWRALGHSRPLRDEHLSAIYNVDRIWLGISHA